MHVQFCCFANLFYLLLFYPSRWRRRSCCLSILLSVTFADFFTSFLLPRWNNVLSFHMWFLAHNNTDNKIFFENEEMIVTVNAIYAIA